MTEQAISPVRRRMIEDMTIRKFAQKNVRGFQLHMTSSGAGVPKINTTISRSTTSCSRHLLRPSSPSQPIPSISAPASACSLCFTPGVRHSPTPT
jgi:hypothetical protein